MYESINPGHSLYTIYLQLNDAQNISIGKLGNFHFQKGIYIYVGSAKKNILHRIKRHKEIEKKYHWHFDYLRPYGTITKIITYDTSFTECGLADKIRKEVDGSIPVKGFGASDCKCGSHLIYMGGL
ncbi:GIY-YIG nuclease family protein [Bacillus benzoevorans]|uniref:Uri superfamily endonuclease n=1 Tax=Bacillus benzoevorans TaxID=1456 RepID=A0A7X0HPM5_9BACI|nr:GIY-YIG nuclease family protein [Bacillus benzoevorans]MBB6444604.1 Uri superfamily endonuclease [Bacillus benzoevorans]